MAESLGRPFASDYGLIVVAFLQLLTAVFLLAHLFCFLHLMQTLKTIGKPHVKNQCRVSMAKVAVLCACSDLLSTCADATIASEVC